MKSHITDFYKDGYARVEFCTICSAEGLALQLECVGIKPDKNQMNLFQQISEKNIDSEKERK